MIAPLVEPTGLELIMEPGRFLVGNASDATADSMDRAMDEFVDALTTAWFRSGAVVEDVRDALDTAV